MRSLEYAASYLRSDNNRRSDTHISHVSRSSSDFALLLFCSCFGIFSLVLCSKFILTECVSCGCGKSDPANSDDDDDRRITFALPSINTSVRARYLRRPDSGTRPVPSGDQTSFDPGLRICLVVAWFFPS
jgi:hypothetical protein